MIKFNIILATVDYGPSYTNLFVTFPTLSIVTSTISPDLRYIGGFLPIPTPPGVPVRIISPGSNVNSLSKQQM